MSLQIIFIMFLTMVIHFVNTLAYSVRIVGVRTGKIAVSFALFNIVVLISRTANTIQAPLIAKTVENSIKLGTHTELLIVFRWILLATTLGTILAGVFVPTFQRMYSKAVNAFNSNRSIPKLLLYGFSKAGIKQFKESLKVPSKNNITQIRRLKNIPFKITIFNMLAVSLLVVGVFQHFMQGYLPLSLERHQVP